MENIQIAKTLDEVADLLEIQGGNPFRVRAYRNAARTINTLGTPVETMLENDGEALEDLPGIGADLAGKISVLCRTGKLPLLAELSRKTPESLVALLRIPGIGPKRAQLIYRKLGVKTVAQLERAARAGRLSKLRGLGPALEQTILRGTGQEKAHLSRVPLADAEAYIRPIVERLQGVSGVARVDVAGSFRRRKETVGDADILVVSKGGAAVAKAFLAFPEVKQTLAAGETRCSVVLDSGIQVDLRAVPGASYGSALQYFTGSKAHSIALRRLGVKRHLKINEYGVFRGRKRIAGRTEAELYATLGLPWIPPELREDRGEIDAARAGRLPTLVEPGDIRGDLQMHTDATDGKNTLAEMVEACRERGYEYHRDHRPHQGGPCRRRPDEGWIPHAVEGHRRAAQADPEAIRLQERRSRHPRRRVAGPGRRDAVRARHRPRVGPLEVQHEQDRDDPPHRPRAAASPRPHPRAPDRAVDRQARARTRWTWPRSSRSRATRA